MLPTLNSRFSAQCAATRLRRLKREDGGALVEYALVFIVFMTIVFGIVGFGQALYAYHFVSNAAREATRYAAVRGFTCANDQNGGSCQASNSASGITGPTTQADITAYVASITPQGINSSDVTATACGVSGASMCSASSSDNFCVVGNANYLALNYPGCIVQVTISYPFNFDVPLLPKSSTTTAPCTKPGLCLSSSSDMTIVH
jgi:Flp pilus assembly protein TadG